MRPTLESWIGVDLDGTLAHYDGWHGFTTIGKPIPAMVARVRRWLAEGWAVKIFTARWGDPNINPLVESAVHQWLVKQGLPPLEVTNVKDMGMIALFDDRAYHVKANLGELTDELPPTL